MVTTPKVKLTWLDLRTKQCCHEHASEIFTIYPATCEPLGIFATGNEYNNLKVHFRVKYPNLNVAGYRNGYYKENEAREIVEMIRISHVEMETLCDDESGVCLDGDEGVF